MLALVEGSQRFGTSVRDAPRKPLDTMEKMMMSVQKSCRQALIQNVCRSRDFPWTTTRATTMPRELYSEVYCDDEWSGLIKCLRIADDTVHRLRYTNKYVEQQIGRFLREAEEIKILSDLSAGVLDELSELDIELNRAVFLEMSRATSQEETRKVPKIVTFANVPRKCKSAEYSVRGVCSSCAVLLEGASDRRRMKVKRRKDYGTYCSECGVIEVPSQNSAIRCRDCDGEIIVQSVCSSCDGSESSRSRTLVDTACSTCDLSRKKRAPSEDSCKTCHRRKTNLPPRKEVVYHVKHSHVPKFVEYPEESSCCSDCDGSSSASDPKRIDRKASADSVVPRSESDHVVSGVRTYSNDCDVSSSLSSSATESVRLECKPATPDRASQSDQTHQVETINDECNSAEEDSFDTPRESLSLENVDASSPSEAERTASKESPTPAEESPAAPEQRSDGEEAELVGGDKTGEEFVDTEREPSEGTSDAFEEASDGAVRDEDALTNISERIEKAEAAISDISEGNAVIEEGVNDMEIGSKENAQLSTILREIVLGMVAHANLVEYQVNYPLFSLEIVPTVAANKPAPASETEEESDTDVYEEAVEAFPSFTPTDSEAETYYDVPSPAYYYICLECGIGTSYHPLGRCNTCGGSLTEIPNGIIDKKMEAHADVASPDPVKVAEADVDLPLVRMKADLLSERSLTPLENRLRSIERDAKLLKNNNEIVNSIIDNFQEKIKDDIRNIRMVTSEWSEGASKKIIGYDLSVYQVRRLITERRSRVNAETIGEMSEEMREDKRTFIEMKFEEVFKKEQQRAVELEIFEQKLEVEGLIIKEKENYFTCSNSTEEVATDVVEETRGTRRQIPRTLSRRITSEKFHAASNNDSGKKDDLTISIEIEVEKESKGHEKKAIRCEYKANLQKNVLRDQSYTRTPDLGRTLPTITLYPMWSRTNRRSVNFGADLEESSLRAERNGRSPYSRYSSGELLASAEPYYMNVDGDDDFVEIKSPKYFRGSSDDESDICAGDTAPCDRRRRRCHSIAAVRLPVAMYPVTEISLAETPLAVVNAQKRICCQMREFGRISQIELEQCPRSGVVLLQRAAVSSLGVLERSGDLPEDTSFEEFYEVRSQHVTSDTSLHRTGREASWSDYSGESLQWNVTGKNTARMVRFAPIYVDGTSVVSIALPDESLPILTLDDVSAVDGSVLETHSSGRFDVVGSKSSFRKDDELHKALTLIHEIENDVVEVKLHSAIAILPQLESILREHLQDKMKLLRKKSSSATVSTQQTASLEVFMSTLNFLTEVKSEAEMAPSRETVAFARTESDERLRRMLTLLTGLEEAVKQINTEDERKPSTPACDAEPNADRICELLRVLSNRIKETASAEPDVADIEKTLDIAAELDVAVRNYSEEMKVSLKSMESSEMFEGPERLERSRASEGFVAAGKLEDMKKKLFGMVASEAEERDARLERDFDRLERLEQENAETMKFLDTLLDKTLRRVGELDEIRQEIFGLRRIIEDIATAMEGNERQSETTTSTGGESEVSLPRIGKTPTLPSIKEVSSDNKTGESSEEDEEEMRKTLSGMIVELDNLKSKAMEKKERYREIFGEGGRKNPEPLPLPEKAVTCLKTEQCDGPRSCTIQINKLGTSTFYLAWTKPVIKDEECVVTGYEIWVNGKVNQRVRNPERLKAVLYSVNSILPGERLRIKLYALTGDGRRLSLSDLKYPDGG